jgi:hypothetical protein
MQPRLVLVRRFRKPPLRTPALAARSDDENSLPATAVMPPYPSDHADQERRIMDGRKSRCTRARFSRRSALNRLPFASDSVASTARRANNSHCGLADAGARTGRRSGPCRAIDCASQCPATRKTRSGSPLGCSRAHRERARRQVEGNEPLVRLVSRRGCGHLDFSTRGDLPEISIIGRHDAFDLEPGLLELGERRVGWARSVCTRSTSARG